MAGRQATGKQAAKRKSDKSLQLDLSNYTKPPCAMSAEPLPCRAVETSSDRIDRGHYITNPNKEL